MFIDAHSHVHVNNFDADREQVIARASASVSKIIEVGFDSEGIFKALALAKSMIGFCDGWNPSSFGIGMER